MNHQPMISEILSNRYKDFNHNNKKNPLNELLFIICSLKTQEKNYGRTYSALKKKFPSFNSIANATIDDIREVIQSGGLENQKAKAIKAIMNQINQEFGKYSLAPLYNFNDSNCEKFLLSLRGVGLKTARCVMMYSLNRNVFPVDSHCWRITKRLGWNKSIRDYRNCSDNEMDYLQNLIEPDFRFKLHVNFVSLGREICSPRKPNCQNCPITHFCLKFMT